MNKEMYKIIFDNKFKKDEEFTIADFIERMELTRPTANLVIMNLYKDKKISIVEKIKIFPRYYRRIK